MKNTLHKLYAKYQILADENGQDLVEYALVVALIGFAATAGMGTLANNINVAFTAIGTRLNSYVS
jgi:pilus assembly protein Flp/PilA